MRRLLSNVLLSIYTRRAKQKLNSDTFVETTTTTTTTNHNNNNNNNNNNKFDFRLTGILTVTVRLTVFSAEITPVSLSPRRFPNLCDSWREIITRRMLFLCHPTNSVKALSWKSRNILLSITAPCLLRPKSSTSTIYRPLYLFILFQFQIKIIHSQPA